MGFSNSKVNAKKNDNSNNKENEKKEEKKPEKIKQEYPIINEEQIEKLKIVLNENLPSPTKWDESKIQSFGYHKALLGYLYAYFDHCPIRLSPNIIWQLIANYFARYVDKNAEKLREKFVNFKGKKDLICVRMGNIEDVEIYKDDLIEEFCHQISEHVGKELIDNLTPNFSTSTKKTIISGKVSIMSTFKKYFNYEVNMLICGIPYIILEGNLNDWEKILEKLKFLKKYDFSSESIENDLAEIINTKKGKINLNFWRNIMMKTRGTTTEMIGCMPEEVEEDFIKGWFLHFYGWESIEKDKINTLMKEVVAAPLNVKDNNEKKKGAIFAGIMDIKQDPNTFEVEPIINYYLALEGEPKYVDPEKLDKENYKDLYPKELFIGNYKYKRDIFKYMNSNEDEKKDKKDPFDIQLIKEDEFEDKIEPSKNPFEDPFKNPFDS